MKNIQKIIILFVTTLICGAVLFLSSWDIPAPVSEIEIVIPNDQFN